MDKCCIMDHFCSLMPRFPGCRSRGPSSILGLDRGPLSLVQLRSYLKGKSSGSGLENRDYGRRGSATLTMRHPSIRKTLTLTLSASGSRSVGIVRSRTKSTELLLKAVSLTFRVELLGKKTITECLQIKLNSVA
jgi:hypothetical protein